MDMIIGRYHLLTAFDDPRYAARCRGVQPRLLGRFWRSEINTWIYFQIGFSTTYLMIELNSP